MSRTSTSIDHTGTTAAGRGFVAAVAAALVLAVIGATSADAKPKPGLVPGTWIGKGTISGSSTDGPFTVHFNGGIAFTVKVAPSLAAKGSGSWRLDMLGSQDGPSDSAVDSSMQGRAAITLTGSGTKLTFRGTQQVVGEIRTGGIARPVSFSRPLTGALTITRAGACRVSGQTRMPDGVRLVWSATLKGSGTCRA